MSASGLRDPSRVWDAAAIDRADGSGAEELARGLGTAPLSRARLRTARALLWAGITGGVLAVSLAALIALASLAAVVAALLDPGLELPLPLTGGRGPLLQWLWQAAALIAALAAGGRIWARAIAGAGWSLLSEGERAAHGDPVLAEALEPERDASRSAASDGRPRGA